MRARWARMPHATVTQHRDKAGAMGRKAHLPPGSVFGFVVALAKVAGAP